VIIDGSSNFVVTVNSADSAATVTEQHGGATIDIVSGGTLTVAGAMLVTSGKVHIESGGALNLGGDFNVSSTAGPITIDSGGTLKDTASLATVSGPITDNGTIEAAGGFLEISGAISGTGKFQIDSGAALELTGTSAENVSFANNSGNSGTLVLDNTAGYTGQISGFAGNTTLSDGIDLKDVTYSASLTPNYNTTTHVLSIMNGATTVASLTILGTYTSSSFKLSDDGTSHLLIKDPPTTIDSGASVEIATASAQSVDFANTSGTNGTLVLDNSAGFTGQVSGFAGDGTVANSDAIDLKDVNFATATETYTENSAGTGGTLTVSDGTHTANIDFAGNYGLANFRFSSDATGGTLIIDPPVVASQNGPGSVTHEVGHDADHTGQHDVDPVGGNGSHAGLSIPQPGTIQGILTNFVNEFESANKLELDNLLAAHGNGLQQLQELLQGVTNGHTPINNDQLQQLAQDLASGHNPLVNSGEDIHVNPIDPHHSFIIHT